MKRRAFTLAELLVVIGVVAVLIGILIPTLASVRRQGWLAGCVANLHTYGSALEHYRAQNSDRFPVALRPADARIGQLAPFDALSTAADLPMPSTSPSGAWRVAPHACPADRELLTGFSYFYPSSLDLVWIYTGTDIGTNLRRYHEQNPSMPTFVESQAWHGPRQSVLLDGSVSAISK